MDTGNSPALVDGRRARRFIASHGQVSQAVLLRPSKRMTDVAGGKTTRSDDHPGIVDRIGVAPTSPERAEVDHASPGAPNKCVDLNLPGKRALADNDGTRLVDRLD